MKDGFQKKFSNGDFLALADDYEGIDKDKYGLVCVNDADKYVMFYIVTDIDGKTGFLWIFETLKNTTRRLVSAALVQMNWFSVVISR